MVQPNPGAQVLTPPTGDELIDVLGLEWQTVTIAQVAGANGHQVISAAGTTQGTATAISNTKSLKSLRAIVTIAATASTHGIKLPIVSTGLTVLVASAGSFGVKVYPTTNQKIGAAATNAADTTIAVNKANVYVGVNTTKWVVQRGA